MPAPIMFTVIPIIIFRRCKVRIFFGGKDKKLKGICVGIDILRKFDVRNLVVFQKEN